MFLYIFKFLIEQELGFVPLLGLNNLPLSKNLVLLFDFFPLLVLYVIIILQEPETVSFISDNVFKAVRVVVPDYESSEIRVLCFPSFLCMQFYLHMSHCL